MNLIFFEWKLIMRNKRLRQQLFISAPAFIWLIYSPLLADSFLSESFLFKEIYLWAFFSISAMLFAPFALNINASFIEKLQTSPLSFFDVLQAKYRLYFIISLCSFVLLIPSLFLGVTLFELLTAFVFAVGVANITLFYTSVFAYKGLEIKASSFANYQGSSAGSFVSQLAVVIVLGGGTALIYWLLGKNATLIAMSVISMFFIATHKIWLKKIANKLEKTKYKRLERFREQ
jgi:hypothetical protein